MMLSLFVQLGKEWYRGKSSIKRRKMSQRYAPMRTPYLTKNGARTSTCDALQATPPSAPAPWMKTLTLGGKTEILRLPATELYGPVHLCLNSCYYYPVRENYMAILSISLVSPLFVSVISGMGCTALNLVRIRVIIAYRRFPWWYFLITMLVVMSSKI